MTGEPGRTTGRKEPKGCATHSDERSERGADQADRQGNVLPQCFLHTFLHVCEPADRVEREVTLLLPEGALPSHRIFPVGNDVGSAVRHDVVVVLSIGGKDLGGTGHLRL